MRDYGALSRHLVDSAHASEPGHVRWLNQSLSRKSLPAEEVRRRLGELFRLPSGGLVDWIRQRFIDRFFGKRPHPFVLALQHPDRAVLLGYVVEHQHFLRQWVRSCAFIMARTDRADVTLYEIDNIQTEFGGAGPDRPSHYELLLRMGESYGLPRVETLATEPLPTTRRTLTEWNDICRREHWAAAMGAMHSLELIAHRGLVDVGATVHYFDPAILTGSAISREAQAFLREGYEADVTHADEALALVTKYARELDVVDEVQGTFLRSIDLFDDYLGARLERADRIRAAQ